jgi:hypothetical protein
MTYGETMSNAVARYVVRLSIKRLLFWLPLLSVALYIAIFVAISERRSDSFAAIRIGDNLNSVIANFGAPSHIERPGALYSRYASDQCKHPCVERLWFENRLSFDLEAWSVELDESGRVVHKSHWVSP